MRAKGAFGQAKFSAKLFAKAACNTMYCNDFNGFITVSQYRKTVKM